jgi:hypothetical protein
MSPKLAKEINVHKIKEIRFLKQYHDVNKMLKTPKKMFTITSFTTGS